LYWGNEDGVHAEKRSNEGPSRREAEVTVLAAVDGGRARVGARILPLTPALARRPGLVGAEVAMTARLADRLPFARSLVVVVPPDVPTASCALLPVAGQALTVSVTCPSPVPHGPGGALSMYNQSPDALPEAFVEAVAAARRCGLMTAGGNVVLLVQEFVPALASAVVLASGDVVHIDGRWGLSEQRSAADSFDVSGSTVESTLARKQTARLATGGGIQTVAMPDEWQHRSSLSRETIRAVAVLSRAAAATAGVALSLDFAIEDRGPAVLRCRPTGQDPSPLRGGR
jgi:hypothetical protein